MTSGYYNKMLINQCFNIGSYVVTICSANMDPGVLQYKNCWKWGHTTFACYFQGARCLKCNGSHKIKYHHYFAWCCKANFKINPPCLETKQGKLYPHSFNCKDDYQADSNSCLFWHHCFNKKWHTKKYQELHDSRAQSIHSIVNSNKHDC